MFMIFCISMWRHLPLVVSLLASSGINNAIGACPHEDAIDHRTSEGSTSTIDLADNSSLVVSGYTLLVDSITPRLLSVEVSNGGRIIFEPSDTETVKLVAHYIVIEDGGSVEIGSESCPFTGKMAEIELIGKEVPSFYLSLPYYSQITHTILGLLKKKAATILLFFLSYFLILQVRIWV